MVNFENLVTHSSLLDLKGEFLAFVIQDVFIRLICLFKRSELLYSID